MIGAIQGFFVVLILVMLAVRFKVGLGLYLAYFILVPYMNISFGGITLQWNFVNLVVLLLSIYEFKYKKRCTNLQYKPLIPFFVFYAVSLVMMLFQHDTPLDTQLNTWRVQAMSYLIFPFALWNEMILDKSSIKLYRNIALVCIVVTSCYGLFLTSMPGLNPYIALIANANGAEFNEAYALALGGGRLFGRISSVFTHPMTFGLFLGLSFVYVFFIRKTINKYMFVTLFSIICVDIFVCGVRSVIGGGAIAIAAYFLQARNFRMVFASVVVGVIGYIIISSTPDMAAYVGSITDINNKNQAVAGSSMSMRIDQLNGCFKEIENNFFFGKGFGWTSFYKELHGDHPVILSFESLIYNVLCNSGFFGILLWIYMLFKIMQYNANFSKEFHALLNAILFFYIAYSCITGEYGYMKFYIIFHVLMSGEALLYSNGIVTLGKVLNINKRK